jgi:hypothetical protein
MEAVEFSVSYSFREYRRFCLDHMPHEFPEVRPGLIARALISIMLVAPFMLKKTKMPSCEFRIDGAGISRRTKFGDLKWPWPAVIAIHRYSVGYLIEKKGGAVPIPYRCLKSDQRERLDALLQIREHELNWSVERSDV